MMKRNHEMEKIYMQQLKNIESAVYFLTQKKREYERDIYKLRSPYNNPSDPQEPKYKMNFMDLAETYVTGVIMAALVTGCASVFLFFVYLFTDIVKHPFIISLKLGVITMFVIWIGTAISNRKEFEESKIQYQRTLTENKKIRENNEKAYNINCSNADRKSVELENIKRELQNAQNIRDNAYNINWIPSKYRNIRVVYYISDMVTTSDINIDEALKYYLLQEANNKLDTILQKLDKIIENEYKIICQQAIIESQNEALISQNKKMISQFANIETNTKLSAEYSAIATNYSSATAYFSLATYLKNY